MYFIPVFVAAAIVSVVAPAQYSLRDQVNEALALADGMKVAVAEHVATTGTFPDTNGQAGLPDSTLIRGKFVTSATVHGERIEFEFGGDADAALKGKHLIVVGKLLKEGNGLEWTCRSVELPASACPSSCDCSG
jgi:type IV pilus assembly protein PilA